MPESTWHTRTAESILREFTVDPDKGLSYEAVISGRKKYGYNLLPRGKRAGVFTLFFGQFRNPLIIILLVAAGLTFWLQEYTDFIVILLAVMVNVVIGFSQEFRSSQIFKQLEKLVKVSASVYRNGDVTDIDMSELVPGDIIVLRGDQKIPADARLIRAVRLLVNESILTGESRGVTKDPRPILGGEAIGDRKNMVYMGTIAERGEGIAVVVGTGAETEIGKIAASTLSLGEERTPLQARIGKLGRLLTYFMGFSSVAIGVVGLLQHRSIVEMFTLAVAVAVAAIPEGLPAALSVVLAVAATRILKRKGLVRKLVGAETLGSTTVIVTDKTGTLTTGSMKTEKIIDASDISRAALAMALASDVVTMKDVNGHIFHKGDETDRAKVQFFTDHKGDLREALVQHPRVVLLPFDQDKKFIASFHREGPASIRLFVTGSPEGILKRSRISHTKADEILSHVEAHAAQSYRMIGIAERVIHERSFDQTLDSEELDRYIHELSFLGVAAIRDPIRDDVRESIVTTRRAGIRVIMATGDHRLTAMAIGRELGFGVGEGAVLSGEEVDAYSDDELRLRLPRVAIFSRVNPGHKMRLVNLLKSSGEVVAMTGDGVNDAPALKAADVGVAIGSGSDVAKEASDLILMNNSFTTISEAIREGRIAFDNIRKVTVFLLSNSFTEILIVLASLIFRTAILPVTAVQILWANLVEDSFPNFALAFEPGEKDVMQRAPLSRKERILDAEGLAIVFIVGLLSDILLVGIFLGLYWYSGFTPQHIQTLVFSFLATNSLFIVFSIKSYHASILHTKFFNNPYLLAAVGIGLFLMALAIYAPPLQTLLDTVPLSVSEVLLVLGFSAAQIVLIEITKWWFRRAGILRVARVGRA